jgi:hypothetical protein
MLKFATSFANDTDWHWEYYISFLHHSTGEASITLYHDKFYLLIFYHVASIFVVMKSNA